MLSPAEIARNALAETGYMKATAHGDANLNLSVGFDADPHVVYKAACLGRQANGLEMQTFEEWVVLVTTPREGRSWDLNRMWLEHHGVDVEGIVGS